MTKKLSQSDLNSQLSEAFNILDEGKIKPNQFKEIIFGLLFLKRYSDLFEQERLALIEKYKELPKTVRDKELENPLKYKIFIPPNSRWSTLQHHNRQIGSELKKAIKDIQNNNTHNQQILGTFLENIDFNKKVGDTSIKDGKYKELLNFFNHLDLSDQNQETEDQIGKAFEYLVKMFADDSGTRGGDFYTPRSVVRLLVSLLDPQPEMSIYDPAAGTSGMLIHSFLHVKREIEDPKIELYGQEKNGENYILGKLNLLMHDILVSDYKMGDTLADPLHKEGDNLKLFDITLSNPKFSTSYKKNNLKNTERFEMGFPAQKNKADLLFLQHMTSVTKDGGNIGIIMPNGVLFRSGKEGEIRKKLIETKWIRAIIGLPSNCFYGSGIPASIIILSKSVENENILIIDASKEFGEEESKNYLRPKDQEKITYVFNNNLEVPKYSILVNMGEIKANEFVLNISRYVDSNPEEEEENVQNHLFGKVPAKELDLELCRKLKFNPDLILRINEKEEELEFIIEDQAQIEKAVINENLVDPLRNQIESTIKKWLVSLVDEIIMNPNGSLKRNSYKVKIEEFVNTVLPLDILEFFTIRGIFVKWWENIENIILILRDNGLLYFDTDESKAKQIILDQISDFLKDEISQELNYEQKKLIQHFLNLFNKYYKSLAELRKEKIEVDRVMFDHLKEIGFPIEDDY